MEGLTQGRIVQYVDTLVTAPDRKMRVAGIVSHVLDQERGEINIHVFAMNSLQPVRIVHAVFSDKEDADPGTWNWPQR